MCADIHDGREHKRSVQGRIQKRKTNRLQIIKSSLQRTAGPYKRAKLRHWQTARGSSIAAAKAKSRPKAALKFKPDDPKIRRPSILADERTTVLNLSATIAEAIAPSRSSQTPLLRRDRLKQQPIPLNSAYLLWSP
jgi:hypothetical protein